MRHEWHQLTYPAVGNPGPRTTRPTDASAADEALGLDRWRSLPRAQTPPWPDQAAVAEVCRVLDSVPAVVAPYEVDLLRELEESCDLEFRVRSRNDDEIVLDVEG